MPNLFHLKKHIGNHGAKWNLFTLASMIFFFIIFDGLIMYLTPIVMQQSHIQLGTIGLVIGLSSVGGMFFDILLVRVLENANHRRIFLYCFLAASSTPLILFGATTITVYLVAMAVWGLYYNLYEIGLLAYVDEKVPKEKQVSTFGFLNVFEGLGYLVAPFIASILLLVVVSNFALAGWSYSFLIIAFIFFLFFSKLGKNIFPKRAKRKNFYNLITEEKFFDKIRLRLLPVLFLTLTLNAVDAGVWTTGPILSEKITPGFAGGAFMIAYMIPPLLSGWIVGILAKKFDKKNTALFALLFGSLLITAIALTKSPMFAIIAIFFVALFWTLTDPTIKTAYTEHIADLAVSHKEIETVDDLFVNLGDTIGPIIAGYSAQFFGLENSFIIIGIIGILASFILFYFMPKNLV